MSESTYPFVWTDDIIGSPDPAPTSSGPTPSPLRPGQPEAPPPSGVVSDPASAGMVEEARQARIAELANDPRRLAGDAWLNDEYGSLLLGGPLKAEPELPTEQPPVELTDQDLPTFTLPKSVAPDDPVIQDLRELTAYSQVPPAVAQTVIDRVVSLTAKGDVLTDEDAEQLGAQAIEEAQARFGPAFASMCFDVDQALALLSGNKKIRSILNNARVSNDPVVFAALAELGKRSRNYYVRRHGTGGQQVVG